MGMDVFGRRPTAPQGEYFRRGTWHWHPLAYLCQALAPDLTMACKQWYSNDGDGLNAKGARQLGERLQQLLSNGSVADYIKRREANMAEWPDVKCAPCDGTGVTELPVSKEGRSCVKCNGKGTIAAIDCHIFVDQQDVEAWIAFLMCCGGFRIC